MTYGDNFDDLIAIGDEELEENRKKAKKEERKTILRNIGIVLLIVIVGVGVFFAATAYNDEQRKQEALRAEAAREEITLQTVNMEQVGWADRTCAVVNSWRYEQFPVYEEETEPFYIKNDMAESLRGNATRMRDNAENISLVPYLAHQHATEIVDDVTLVNNYRVVGPDQDHDLSHASQSVSASMMDYAQSMEDMASDLENIAMYDFNGMRTGILRVGNFFDEMNEELRGDLSDVLTLELFDNPMTMDRVASLESCNENMISQEMIAQEYGDEIREQKVLEDIVIQDRCEALLNNNELIQQIPGEATTTESTTTSETTTTTPDEEASDNESEDSTTDNQEEGTTEESETTTDTSTTTTTPEVSEGDNEPAQGTNSAVLRNIRACENFLTTTVIDPNHPIHDKRIKTVDSEIARPDLTVNDKKIDVTEELDNDTTEEDTTGTEGEEDPENNDDSTDN